MYQGMKARFIEVIASGVNAISIWDGKCGDKHNLHRSSVEYARLPPDAENWDGVPEPTPEQLQGLEHCERCGAPRPADAKHSRGMFRIYNTPSGKPEPGDLFWVDWYSGAEKGKCIYGWTNCTGKHLYAVLPNGHQWDIDSRASNCTKKDDTTHRCWVRHGEVPNIHVDKQGHTCAAGAGSIVAGDYHGFLHHGAFTVG